MDLLRSWSVAFGVCLLGSVMSVAIVANAAPLSLLESVGGRILTFYLPSLAVAVLMAGAAALVHPPPARERPRRHAVAVTVLPAVVLVGSLVNSALQGVAAEVYVASVVSLSVGTAAGWGVADLLRPSREDSIKYGYPL